MPHILETDHLRLRQFKVSDGAFVVALVNTPGWLEHIGNRDIHTVEEAQLYLLTGPMTSYDKLGYGLYLVELKESGTPIGMCGLIKREVLSDVDIGFAFLPEYCGKGYAYEAATATLQYAHSRLGISNVVAITNKQNNSSINLLKKLGLVYQKTVKFPDDNEDLLLFARSQNGFDLNGAIG
jgi:RimJ/RimL family protein N-acetyltransferase